MENEKCGIAPLALLCAMLGVVLSPACGGCAGNGDLTGRLIVNQVDLENLNWVSVLYDLQSGAPVALPSTSDTFDGADDDWVPSPSGDLLVRTDSASGKVGFFDAGSLQKRSELLIRDLTEPAISPDGKYLLTLWFDAEAGAYIGDRNLTVFDVDTGDIVEWGSLQPNAYTYGRGYAWLPDNSYIYMVGRTLYRTVPKEPDASVLLELDSLPQPTTTTLLDYELAVSPDGNRLAITWSADDDRPGDTNIWVVNLDGTDLHRVTSYADRDEVLTMTHGMPTWSPDGTRLALVRYMSGVVTAPVDEQNEFSGYRVVGGTGCIDQVFVVSPDDRDVSFAWPKIDETFGVKGQLDDGTAAWLTTCGGSVSWLR